MTEDKDKNEISMLRSKMDSLNARIKELETQNANLTSQLSLCRCPKNDANIDDTRSNHAISDSKTDSGVKKLRKSKKKTPDLDLRALLHLPRRHIAFKVMYFGQRFYGFASEAQLEPTVESELFKAFQKTRLLLGDRKESQYSRCGRTDKGVSATGQVIALYVRSNLRAKTPSGEFNFEGQYDELDYVRILNRVLPRDIRIISWCPVPADFHARFSCLSREYKYFFWEENLNISAMQSAGKKFLGEHDFRNFCKMDAVHVHNYMRNVTSFDISPSTERWRGKELWVIKIRGSAFLWHQVRCMVAVLFMIGRGLESEEIIDVLLNLEKTPKKPQYTMAPEMPLVLHSCEFKDLALSSAADARQALCSHLENECHNLILQAAIYNDSLNCCSYTTDEGNDSLVKEISAKKYLHIPLMKRPTEPSYMERRAKLDSGAVKKGTGELFLGAEPPEDGR
ncbi:uncharacterized protein LOC141605463 isoform X2 [Silene latifolia]|uniref:uncharacterized protein LOC141605463 isoform X2 n=1 Tax=Silene latifolia TaxID=37657 RepID=UPI003D77A709